MATRFQMLCHKILGIVEQMQFLVSTTTMNFKRASYASLRWRKQDTKLLTINSTQNYDSFEIQLHISKL